VFHIHKPGRKLGISLVVNWLIPVVMFTVLRYFITNDTTTLALVVAIPAVRTIAVVVLRRRVDWIGVISVMGFAVALVVSVLSGGSSLPLKLYHPLLTGTLGLAFLISAVIKKPLLLTLLKFFKHSELELTNDPVFRKKITIMSVVVGLLLLADAVAHIIMALTLPTGTYLGMSKLVTIAMVGLLINSLSEFR
jgi:hypothetical protein